jgi:FlaA1/EpsC-like NDP-sugar epimerase
LTSNSITSFINTLTILPRWVIIIIDFFVLILAGILGYSLRFNFNTQEIAMHDPLMGIALLAACGTVASLITKSYAGIVRYTGIDDAVKILFTSLLGLSMVGIVNLIYYYNFTHNVTPYSVLVIYFFCSVIGLLFYRLLVKNIYSFYKGELSKKGNVVIFGAGHLGISTKQALDADVKGKLKVVGFLEDDPHKIGKVVHGIEIYSSRYLPKLVRTLGIREVIIAVRELSQERKNHIVDICLRYHLKVKTVSSVEDWVSGNLNSGHIREIKIEDLLGRSSIAIDDEHLISSLKGKRVLITGAAGSIGSELARQVLLYHPRELVLIDQAESALYELQLELATKVSGIQTFFYLADITNEDRIGGLLKNHKPEILFHAAAYKHVPLMESNPSEAIKTNVLGTKILADLALKYSIAKFVMISTDKAVNPTNVMGCSKRIAEIYVQSLNNHLELVGNSRTRFITTRFGNVLGSNGSVIPLFTKQIETGGPLTVTHPEVIRYFMTIPEACRLVLEAGVMGKGGEIFIFDMGRPIRIYDLARKMALLAGLSPGKDIDIVFTGLRDGEKLYEELLSDAENTIPTHHDKILKAKVAEYPYSEVLKNIEFLSDLIHDHNELKMVAMMKEIVPEFKSNYSRFEVLDRVAE